ncbi:GNAT family N-acetyltransferase [Parasediminibacterium paludis]|uniref:GNAT family N-acetyltransferase n=1 Tax=Parasediminibacterium paludis TaxID=908966 RepID=A0ABV8PWN5_9BACT
MVEQINIDTAVAKDAHTIHQFIQQLEGITTPFGSFKDIFLYNLQQPNILYLVARVNDQIVCFISAHGQLLLHHAGYVYEIQELFVDEKYRGRGIGKTLLSSIERKIKSKNAVAVEVTANKIRETAHLFYSNNGFAATHVKFTKSITH